MTIFDLWMQLNTNNISKVYVDDILVSRIDLYADCKLKYIQIEPVCTFLNNDKFLGVETVLKIYTQDGKEVK